MGEAKETEVSAAHNFVPCHDRDVVCRDAGGRDGAGELWLGEIGVHAQALCDVEIGSGHAGHLTALDYGRPNKTHPTGRALGSLRDCRRTHGHHAEQGHRENSTSCHDLLLCSHESALRHFAGPGELALSRHALLALNRN